MVGQAGSAKYVLSAAVQVGLFSNSLIIFPLRLMVPCFFNLCKIYSCTNLQSSQHRSVCFNAKMAIRVSPHLIVYNWHHPSILNCQSSLHLPTLTAMTGSLPFSDASVNRNRLNLFVQDT